MKVVFLSRLYAPHVGGVEKHVERVSMELAMQGHDLTVITESVGLTKREEELHGIQVHRIPVGSDEKRKKWEVWHWMWQHRKILRDADIIHAHDVYFWYIPFRFYYFWKRSYITFHGYEGYPIRLRAKIQRKIAEVLSRGNICVGKFIQKWYGTKPTYVTYGAVDVHPVSEQPDPLTAGFIGRLEPLTGITAYTKATEIVQQKYPKFALRIAGDGSLRKGLEKHYEITQDSDAVTFLMRSEFAFVAGYLTILEALTAKRLVFAYADNPLKRDYISMTPYRDTIIICNTPEEIAEKVVYYLSHENEAQELIRKGFEIAKEQSWQKLAETYLKLWNK